MPQREPRTVRVDPDVWTAFTEWVTEHEGQKRGELGRHVENALNEYTDNDRYSRVEEKLDRVLGHVSQDMTAHTHTGMSASESVEKAREIIRRIADNHGTVVRESDVVRAIEDIAGGDDRTVDKYLGILRRRGLLFCHPGDSVVWTVEREKWVSWVESYVDNNPTIGVGDVIDEYGLSIGEYSELVEGEV